MKSWILVTFLVFMIVLLEVQGRRGGGRGSSPSRGSPSRVSPSRGGTSSGSTYRGSTSTGKKPGGRKSSLKSKLVKGAVIGAGVYVGYKATKAAAKFAGRAIGGGFGGGIGRGYQYNDWNRWRQDDGMLCRNDGDCWLDDRLECQDYELDFSMNRGWFGGDYLAIRGQCQCRDGWWWQDNDLSCQVNTSNFWGGVIGIIIILAIISISCCCCIGIGCLICRKM